MIIVLAQATCQACLPLDLLCLQLHCKKVPNHVLILFGKFHSQRWNILFTAHTLQTAAFYGYPNLGTNLIKICELYVDGIQIAHRAGRDWHIGQLGPCGLGWILHWILLAIRKPSTNPCRQRMPPESVLGVSLLHWREHKLG